jgi:hypothetical protein
MIIGIPEFEWLGFSTGRFPFFSCKGHALSTKRVLFFLQVFFVLSFALGQPGEQTYTIRKGDTLWDIAFRFLGDPFAWPHIWHQNSYIKDPNLIFPGDKLTISGNSSGLNSGSAGFGGTGSFSSGEPVAGTRGVSPSDSFFSETKQAIEQSEAQSRAAVAPSAGNTRLTATLFDLSLHGNRYFTADFLEKIGFLLFDNNEKGRMYPGNAVIRKKGKSAGIQRYEYEPYQQYDDIIIEPDSKSSYRAGDTVSILHSDQFVKFGSRTANLVRRTGRARLTEVKPAGMTAVLFKMWDVVQSDDRVDTLARFTDMAIDTIVDPQVTVKGTVLLRIENTERPYLYQTCILDRGSKDGVVLGDVFAVLSRRSSSAGHPEAVACAVNVRETSSTVVIEKLFEESITIGDTAVIVKRIQFKK